MTTDSRYSDWYEDEADRFRAARREIEYERHREPRLCARCGLPPDVHGHGESGREDSHPFMESLP